MFGAICAGRPVQTNLITISPTQFTFSLPVVPSFNHIVVFLLPGNALPSDCGAAVYVRFPQSVTTATNGAENASVGEFKFLGAIANEKQSAIFRINQPAAVSGKLDSAAESGAIKADDDAMTDEDVTASSTLATGPPDEGREIILGISIEPAASIAAQLATLQAIRPVPSTSQAVTAPAKQITKTLAQQIIQDAYNYLASFAEKPSAVAGGGFPSDQEVVPLKSFRDWWTKFEKRVELDPSFLEKDSG
ncbi:MAG: hypothetical protein M1817_005382 [Caeruleum heppii]|nr:MAG: hypothetical protein M1817_005382 [Caeruleum heppii]